MKFQAYLLAIFLIVSCGKKEDQSNSDKSSDISLSQLDSIKGNYLADYRSYTSDHYGFYIKCNIIDNKNLKCVSSGSLDTIILSKAEYGYTARFNQKFETAQCEYLKDTLNLCKYDFSDLITKCYIQIDKYCIVNAFALGSWGNFIDKFGQNKLVLKFPNDDDYRTYTRQEN